MRSTRIQKINRFKKAFHYRGQIKCRVHAANFKMLEPKSNLDWPKAVSRLWDRIRRLGKCSWLNSGEPVYQKQRSRTSHEKTTFNTTQL